MKANPVFMVPLLDNSSMDRWRSSADQDFTAMNNSGYQGSHYWLINVQAAYIIITLNVGRVWAK
jgi:hypothetical protein